MTQSITIHKPIWLLNTISKVLELLLLDRLKLWAIYRPKQHEFKAQHSKVIENITNYFNLNYNTAAALLDIEKAFDKVWYKGLIYKIIYTGVPNQLT